MSIEGKISIELTIQNQALYKVKIDSQRPVFISNFFAEKSIAETGKIINSLYYLCNNAHRFAYLKLLDKTGFLQLSQNETLAFEVLLSLETIKEHVFTITGKWQHGLEVNAQLASILKIINDIKQVLFAGTDAFSIEQKNIVAGKSIAEEITKFDMQLAMLLLNKEVLELPESLSKLIRQLEYEESLVANFYKYLKANNYLSLCNVKCQSVFQVVKDAIEKKMTNREFIRCPSLNNNTYETTPLSRQLDQTLIKQLMKKYGTGLLTRSIAQVLDIEHHLNLIKKTYLRIQSEKIKHKKNEVNKTAFTSVEAARGRLFHRLKLDAKTIAEYQVLAPTEWNFHPQGVLFKMLNGLEYKDEESLKKETELMVNAVDPCVGYEIKIQRI